jgi:predicted aspartyl protease
MKEHKEMGRFSVEFVIANYRDVVRSATGEPVLDSKAKRMVVSGVVDSRAARLVLPKSVADQLQLPSDGETIVRYTDQRRQKRARVGDAWIELQGRHGVFSAVVEPDRKDALIGAIVLEELDLLVDCTTQTLHPRDPDTILTEIEEAVS